MKSERKRPADINILSKSIVDQATKDQKPSSTPTSEPTKEKNPAAVALGRLGGLKGGPARARSLSPKKREEFARKAAKARWSNK